MDNRKNEHAKVLRGIARRKVRVKDARDILESVAAQLDSEAKHYEESEQLQEIGENAAKALAEMVAALECDYERLAELRDLRDNKDENGLPPSNDERKELAELEESAGDCESREDAEERIQEDPLSIELSGKWSPGEKPTADYAYILLGTGGPATRIVCQLDERMRPYHAWIEAQDWFKPWTQYVGDAISRADLLTYCRCFYF